MKGSTPATIQAATNTFDPKLRFLLLYIIIGGVALALYQGDEGWRESAEVLRDCVILTWIVSLVNMLLLGNGLGRLLGIRPRQPLGLLGVFFSPLIHRDLAHLVANTLPFLVLGWFILVQGELGGSSFYTITLTILLIGGLGTWLLGRDAIHLGASGLIFGYIGFLLINGYQVQTLLTIGFAVIVFFMYGSQLWSMLPSSNENKVSWEGHLFGFVGGIVAGTRPDLLATVSEALNQLVQ